jgi:hypothetical protein
MSNAGGVIVAIRMRKERQIVAVLRESAALSAATAKPLPPHRLSQSALRSLMRNGAVAVIGGDHYYLDEAGYNAMRSTRRRKIGVILLVVLAAAVASFVTVGVQR